MARLIALFAIVVIGGVAPARAWCEATCLAPAEASQSHCPTTTPTDGTSSISANLVDACPALEAARPTTPARLDVNTSPIATYVPATRSLPRFASAFARPRAASTVFERSTPLRI